MKKNIILAIVTTILISFMLIQIPSVFSSELTSPEKTLIILKDVIGLNTAAYSTNLDKYNQDLYLEVLPQENVKYTFESDENKLEVICTFVTEKLRSIQIYSDASPQIIQYANNNLETAKNFLNKYQTISNASYYETMGSMLNSVEPNKNVTKISENIKLEVIETESYTSYRWTYTINGVEAPSKCVALKFENGFLKYFIDNWSFYTIGNTDINISEEEAVKIAKDHTNNYSWTVSMGTDNPLIQVTEFNIEKVGKTTLMFGNYVPRQETRGGTPLTLYAGWRIKLYFDKLYHGNVYGLDVGIWADTGEVNDIRTLKLLGDYPSTRNLDNTEGTLVLDSNENVNNKTSSNNPVITWMGLSTAIMIGVIIVYSKKEKKASHDLHKKVKTNSLRLSGILICFLIMLTIFPMVMSNPTANASDYVIGLYGSTWEVETDEQNAAHSVINVWESYFDNWADYTCYDLFGSQT